MIPIVNLRGRIAMSLGLSGDRTCVAVVAEGFGTGTGVQCWGQSGSGILGATQNSVSYSYLPTQISTREFKHNNVIQIPVKIDIGGRHACALLSIGRLTCWGVRSLWGMGYAPETGDTGKYVASSSVEFVETGSLSKIRDFSIAGDNTCVLFDAPVRTLRCWGIASILANGLSVGVNVSMLSVLWLLFWSIFHIKENVTMHVMLGVYTDRRQSPRNRRQHPRRGFWP